MYDIKFFQGTAELKKMILKGGPISPDDIFGKLEVLRNENPYIFNIETTNNCNMTCSMCPRTNLMEREITYISDQVFNTVLDQAGPHNREDFEEFKEFIRREYGIEENHCSEDAFYFHVVSNCITLHGYGEPIIDPNIVKRVQACTDRNLSTYFSCVPANINIKRMVKLMEAGLSVIKFSIDALDDAAQKAIRGRNNNFKKAFEKIVEIINYKNSHPKLKTTIVVTMISFSDSEAQLHKDFMDMWKDYPVYAYIKSQDNKWYFEKKEDAANRSHYMEQYCEYPWTSLTVMANGVVVPCTQDYNCEMNMGNINDSSLKDIWNNNKYTELRKAHITGKFSKGHKCKDKCDIRKIYEVSSLKY